MVEIAQPEIETGGIPGIQIGNAAAADYQEENKKVRRSFHNAVFSGYTQELTDYSREHRVPAMKTGGF